MFYGQTDLTLDHGWPLALFAGNLNTGAKWIRDWIQQDTPSFPNYQQDLPEIKFTFPSVFAYFIIVRIIKEVCEAEAGGGASVGIVPGISGSHCM